MALRQFCRDAVDWTVCGNTWAEQSGALTLCQGGGGGGARHRGGKSVERGWKKSPASLRRRETRFTRRREFGTVTAAAA